MALAVVPLKTEASSPLLTDSLGALSGDELDAIYRLMGPTIVHNCVMVAHIGPGELDQKILRGGLPSGQEGRFPARFCVHVAEPAGTALIFTRKIVCVGIRRPESGRVLLIIILMLIRKLYAANGLPFRMTYLNMLQTNMQVTFNVPCEISLNELGKHVTSAVHNSGRINLAYMDVEVPRDRDDIMRQMRRAKREIQGVAPNKRDRENEEKDLTDTTKKCNVHGGHRGGWVVTGPSTDQQAYDAVRAVIAVAGKVIADSVRRHEAAPRAASSKQRK